ncbi:hypothetical protein M885DRAFT_528346 [Pelagophyceae sp. CCMP2097]|nr:hypothetical protein M885DRAFT_528346 [Pelagophyceae sp. CCMP2097]|mmetsp:Transcript_28190/g.94952  ORF Transcript_28190/g.94952 Transcript_28190/m.94952 type:complete len:209 (-) Transcript_28190:95-721(-)
MAVIERLDVPGFAVLLAVALLSALFLLLGPPSAQRQRQAAAKRGDNLVVVECAKLTAKAKHQIYLAAKPALVKFVDCSADFGAQISGTKAVSAKHDNEFSAIFVVEPFQNFEEGGLGTHLGGQLLSQYHWALHRASGRGNVPVYAAATDMPLLRLQAPASWGLAPPKFQPAENVPKRILDVFNAVAVEAAAEIAAEATAPETAKPKMT